LFEKEGVALAILIFVFPLVFIALFNRVLPVFEPADTGNTNGAEGQPA